MPRNNYLQVRLDEKEKETFEQKAIRQGLPLAAWIRLVLCEHVRVQAETEKAENTRAAVLSLSGSRGMAEEKAPVEFETVLKEEAKRYNLAEDKLREEIKKELYARVAREIVEKMIAGEVLFPKEEPVKPVWGSRNRD